MHINSFLEVLVGKTNEDRKIFKIKDKESHFLLKYQMGKSVSMGAAHKPKVPSTTGRAR